MQFVEKSILVPPYLQTDAQNRNRGWRGAARASGENLWSLSCGWKRRNLSPPSFLRGQRSLGLPEAPHPLRSRAAHSRHSQPLCAKGFFISGKKTKKGLGVSLFKETDLKKQKKKNKRDHHFFWKHLLCCRYFKVIWKWFMPCVI